ncbi:unnamed protein product [Lupinus luteus]|uniref:Time for coffee n=1 Tax=Lupinus luteus TaxID=3873 RepID=A0AAV1X3D1_LUPLU
MERNTESRKSSISKRSHRAIPLRDSSEETSSNRRRNRDSERNKRRRTFNSHSHTTDDDSAGNEQDEDVRDAGDDSFMRSNNTILSTSDQNHRRSFMIGVAVPRKARSASVKRSPASGGEEQNFRQRWNSPGRDSVEPASTSSDNVSARKMQVIGGGASTSKSSSSDVDIEMAELLFGLMTSKNHELKDVEEKEVEDYNTTADLDCHENGSSEAPKKDIGKDKLNSGAGCDGVTADGRSVSPTRESLACSKLDFDKQDTSSATVMAKHQRTDKFEIDLMASPSTMLPPDRDDLSRGEFTSKTTDMALDVEMKRGDSIKVEDKVGKPIKKETKKGRFSARDFHLEETLQEFKEVKMFNFKEKRDMPNHDLEKPNNDNDINLKLEEQDKNKEQLTKSSNPGVDKTAQSSSVPFSTAVSGRPSSVSSIGYMPPLQTVVKMNKTTGLLTETQNMNFVLSQPRPKRCATHQYIARNIFLHQQFSKTKPHLPAAVGSTSLCGTTPNDVPSAESMVVGKQSSKHLAGVNQGLVAATSDPSLAATKNSNNAYPLDSTHRMQLVLQQGPTGNLVHGPASLFPPGQHQASVAVATSQAGGVNSASRASSYTKSHSSAAGSVGNSSTLPTLDATMSFKYPKFSASDTPYMTIVQNNGYSFPLSTSLGANAATRGTSPAQATHIINGPFYSSQIVHPLHHPQQHLHPQAPVQSSYLTASTSSGSSSHKQSQGAQVNGNSILTSTMVQPQQLQKQQTSLSHPRQYGTEMSGENTSSVASRTSYPSKNMQWHNYTIPVHPMNLSFKPSATSDTAGGNDENFGDKKQQQQASKGGVEVVPSQAFAISFPAFNGTNAPSNLNFSSIIQNPVIFQSLPDAAWQGYQAASTSHTKQKTNSITEGNSSHQDDEKKNTHGKSSTNGPTTLVFDNSSKNLNFMLSPTNGNWPSQCIASTAITSVPLSSNASNSQQTPQLLQLQKQHGMQQQQNAMATRYKASSTNNTARKFVNNAPVFSQTVAQCKSSNQGSHSKSSGRTVDSHVHQTSGITSNAPTHKSFAQEHGRVSQGHMQISFSGNYINSLPAPGQQLLNSNQPLYSTAAGTRLNEGNLKPSLDGRKVGQ